MIRTPSLPLSLSPLRAAGFAVAACLLAAPVALPRPAAAQSSSSADVRSLADQVDRLQRELSVLQRNVYQGQGAARPSGSGAAPAGDPGSIADLQVRLDDMDSRISQLVGQIEETNHRVTTMEQKFDRLSSDIDVRLSGAANGGTAMAAPGQSAANQSAAGQPTDQGAAPAARAQAQPTPPSGAGNPSQNPTTSGNLGTLSSGDPQTRGTDAQAAAAAAAAGKAAGPSAALSGPPLPAGTPDDQYKYAFGLLSRADYPGAERALSAFVEQHPTHSLAGNAQYWLGESYYARNDFNSAARAFAIGYQKYPKSAKAPDNLLKLGLSLGNLGKTKEACQSYGLLKKDFPKAPAELLRRADGEQKRLRCS
ncbi:MAG TPA: tol-pal system protein YbgF [Alphaproteobacteria bacterium]|jgi:tol-pal system protein YbgF